MKGTVRIISGSLKGRVIPFHINKSGNPDITPQKVKGAVFSIIGETLTGKTFIDLFAGSGQIGFEAVSRGCGLVVFNEKDKRRYDLIRDFAALTCTGSNVKILNMNASSALKYLSGKGITADFIYLDPPYVKEKSTCYIYNRLLEDISQSGIVSGTTTILIQHFSSNDLPGTCGILKKSGVKKYGSTSLSIYFMDVSRGEAG